MTTLPATAAPDAATAAAPRRLRDLFFKTAAKNPQPAKKNRQRIAAAAVAAGLMAAGAPEAAQAQAGRGPTPASIVYDAEGRTVLFEYNSATRIYPASTTKLMTAYLTFQALESGRLRRDQMLTVSANAANQPRTNLGMMSGRRQVVSRISVDDALRGLMVHSANDAAVVLGETLGGNRAGFARMMTNQARSLGMRNSTFFNANGLGDPTQVVTARDMVTLMEAIQRDFPQYYREYLGVPSFTYRGTTWTNTNRLLGSATCPGVDGGKTGYIRASGTNIVLSAERHGHRVIVGVFGRSSGAVRNELACNMVNYAYVRLFSEPGITYDVDRTYPIVMPPAPAADTATPPVVVPVDPTLPPLPDTAVPWTPLPGMSAAFAPVAARFHSLWAAAAPATPDAPRATPPRYGWSLRTQV